MNKRPNSKVNLDRAIQRLYGTQARYVEIRSIIANTVVGQFLPQGVVKGGSALRLRYGMDNTRVTIDFDTAHRNDIEDFITTIGTGLRDGWSGFTGEVIRRNPATPKDIPAQYVMQPFDVKLRYMKQPWCTVRLEVGYDEIGDAQIAEEFIAHEILDIFKNLCLDEPKPIPLMPLTHQVAQKLHGVSEPNSSRAHDLVDLQLIFSRDAVDLKEVSRIAKRLFANRRRQPWPSLITKGESWDSLYADAAEGLEVLETVDEAVAWANELIERIDTAN
jgi:hypothetical protein